MTTKAPTLEKAKQELRERNIPLIEVDKFGYVALIGFYGSDEHICEVTRLTSNSKSKDNVSLIRYLMRHRHSSPFEFADIEFEVALPIGVERQWIRHRTAKTNEVSARYSELPGECWELPIERIVHSPTGFNNRQGSGLPFPPEEFEYFLERYNFCVQNAVNTYSEFCTKDLAPEVARMHLPLATYTRKRWKCDLHNLLHFLGLRIDGHAQKEIQNYANAVATFTKQLFPISYQAFEDYRMNAVTFSKQECEILAKYLNNAGPWAVDYLSESVNDERFIEVLKEDLGIKLGKTELQEFKNKLKKVFDK